MDEETRDRVMRDLTKTAIDRTIKSVGLITQLIDDDDDAAYVFMAVAAAMITASARHLEINEDFKRTEAQSIGIALKGLLTAIGTKKMKAVLKQESKEEKGKK